MTLTLSPTFKELAADIISKYQADPMQRDLLLWQSYEELAESNQSLGPFLFFYQWKQPALSLGKIQSNKANLIQTAQELSIPVFERPTGGKAVLHGNDICYIFLAKNNDPEFGGSLADSFAAVNELILDKIQSALELDQIQAYKSCDDKEIRKSQDNCFASSVKHENFLEFNGEKHKVIGAAQKMGQRVFIQQGSIQINKQELPWALFQEQKSVSEITGKSYDLGQLTHKLNQPAIPYPD